MRADKKIWQGGSLYATAFAAGRQAAISVARNRQAIVIGPTPPGTGVIAPAISSVSAKQTSPTSRVLPAPFSGAGRGGLFRGL